MSDNLTMITDDPNWWMTRFRAWDEAKAAPTPGDLQAAEEVFVRTRLLREVSLLIQTAPAAEPSDLAAAVVNKILYELVTSDPGGFTAAWHSLIREHERQTTGFGVRADGVVE